MNSFAKPASQKTSTEQQTFSVDENAADGTVLGTIKVLEDEQRNFRIVHGNEQGAFHINEKTGAISVENGNLLDFETRREYRFDVKVQNTVNKADDFQQDFFEALLDSGVDRSQLHGLSTQDVVVRVTVQVSNLPETPQLEDLSLRIPEHSFAKSILGTISAFDEDDDDKLTYSIVAGNDGNVFTIDPVSGELSVENSSLLDADKRALFQLTIRATDATGLTDDATAMITLINVNEPPSVTGFRFFGTNEETNDMVFGVVTASDSDAGDTLRFEIVEDPTSGAFAIDGSEGTLSIADSKKLASWSEPLCRLIVSVTDSNGLSSQSEIAVELRELAADSSPTSSATDDVTAQELSATQTGHGHGDAFLVLVIASFAFVAVVWKFRTRMNQLLYEAEEKVWECHRLVSQLKDSTDRCAHLEAQNAALKAELACKVSELEHAVNSARMMAEEQATIISQVIPMENTSVSTPVVEQREPQRKELAERQNEAARSYVGSKQIWAKPSPVRSANEPTGSGLANHSATETPQTVAMDTTAHGKPGSQNTLMEIPKHLQNFNEEKEAATKDPDSIAAYMDRLLSESRSNSPQQTDTRSEKTPSVASAAVSATAEAPMPNSGSTSTQLLEQTTSSPQESVETAVANRLARKVNKEEVRLQLEKLREISSASSRTAIGKYSNQKRRRKTLGLLAWSLGSFSIAGLTLVLDHFTSTSLTYGVWASASVGCVASLFLGVILLRDKIEIHKAGDLVPKESIDMDEHDPS